MRSLVAALVGLAASAGLAACAPPNTGVVELAWVFVDCNGDPIFPGGVFSLDVPRDSCDLPGRTPDGTVRYDLHVELEMCDATCEAGCQDPECLVMPATRFECDSSRGADREVPASEDPYQFTLRAVIEAPSGECTDPDPSCISVPGPRERLVTEGLVTDLQVYQIAVDVRSDSSPLDLEACGCA